MRCASSKLHTRARMRDCGLNAAQARNWPSCDSTRTVSPLSPPPLAMALSKIQGWRRCSERSLPGLSRIVFIPGLCVLRQYPHQLRTWGLAVTARPDTTATIQITDVPEIAHDKCLENPSFLEYLALDYLDWLAEHPHDAQLRLHPSASLYQKLQLCPRPLKELFNSKACRSAIMFHHPLDNEQCRALIADLSRCDYAFQCAHGRPSLIPLCFLD